MPTLQTNGVETYYERRGEGPSVVFVHASVLDHSQWDGQVAALADDYTTVAYDVRGHGRTGGSAAESYSIGLFAEDLHALVEGLDLDRPVVCGHSMGGLVAQRYAATYPDEVGGLVLADTWTPPILGVDDWFVRRLMLNAAVLPARLFGYERVERAHVWLYERLFAGSSGQYGRIVDLREGMAPMATDEFVKVIRATTGDHESSIDLPTIPVPSLVLFGADDLPFVKRHAAELAARIPSASVTEVPRAGHASNLDNPEFFTATLREFLATLRRLDSRSSPPPGDDGVVP